MEILYIIIEDTIYIIQNQMINSAIKIIQMRDVYMFLYCIESYSVSFIILLNKSFDAYILAHTKMLLLYSQKSDFCIR